MISIKLQINSDSTFYYHYITDLQHKEMGGHWDMKKDTIFLNSFYQPPLYSKVLWDSVNWFEKKSTDHAVSITFNHKVRDSISSNSTSFKRVKVFSGDHSYEKVIDSQTEIRFPNVVSCDSIYLITEIDENETSTFPYYPKNTSTNKYLVEVDVSQIAENLQYLIVTPYFTNEAFLWQKDSICRIAWQFCLPKVD